MVKIKKGNEVILEVEVDDSSVHRSSIMQENSVCLYYSLVEHVELPIGCYIEYNSERYTLRRPENFTLLSSRNFSYEVKFTSSLEELKIRKLKNLSGIPHEIKFSLTASAKMFIELIVDNMNVYDNGWKVGDCIDTSERLLSFNHEYCYDSLQRMANEFNTEWEIEGKTIHFRKIEKYKNNPLPLSYGKGNGLKSGTARRNKSDKSPVTILYVQGGERNIDYSTYQSKYLLLPKSQKIEYEGRSYITDEHGMFITRADHELTVYNEDSFDGSHFYPSRMGEVTDVEVSEEGFYDIIDKSIPEDLNYTDYRLNGYRATIIFQSGVLTGREFDIEQTEDQLTGYVHSERRFKLVPLETDGITLPNANLKPAKGDKYAVFNISLPDNYICDNKSQSGASWEMYQEAVRYIYENEEEAFSYSGDLDGIWVKKNRDMIAGRIIPGGYTLFSDSRFQKEGVLIRITLVEQNFNNPHNISIQLSNVSIGGFLSSELGELDSKEVINEDRYKSSMQYTLRRWRDVMETFTMMFDPEGYYFTELITPLAVHTAELIVGTNSQQFDLIEVRFIPNANHSPSSFQSTAGKLVHFTVNQEGITEWNIGASSHTLSNSSAYYVYARCSKTAATGEIIATIEQIKLLDVEGYYHFLIGILNTPVDGVRSWNPNYGYTEIAGQTITTGVIKDKQGNMVIDLIKGTIEGPVTFKSGSSGLSNTSEWNGLQNDIGDAKNSAEQAKSDAKQAKDDAYYWGQDAKDSLAYRLGYSDFTQMQRDARLGKTLIDGGYINTDLIEAEKVVTTDLLANIINAVNIKTSKLEVLSGAKIAGWKVNGDKLENQSGTVYMDGATGAISLGGGKILLNHDGSGKLANGNISWNSAGNLEISGNLSANQGFRLGIRTVSSNITLTTSDCYIQLVGSVITVHLPSSPLVGQMLYFVSLLSGNVYINPNGKRIYSGMTSYTTYPIGAGHAVQMVYVGGNEWYVAGKHTGG